MARRNPRRAIGGASEYCEEATDLVGQSKSYTAHRSSAELKVERARPRQDLSRFVVSGRRGTDQNPTSLSRFLRPLLH